MFVQRRQRGSAQACQSSTGSSAAGSSLLRWCSSGAARRGRSTLLLAALGDFARAARRACSSRGGVRGAGRLRPTSSAAPSRSRSWRSLVESVCATLEQERPDVCVIVSVQTLYWADSDRHLDRSARFEAAGRLLGGEGSGGCGHPRRPRDQGRWVAGHRVLEHLVDCVLQFEGDAVRASCARDRGPTRLHERLGVFEMTGRSAGGRRRPAALRANAKREIGAAVACALEGTRPILLEIQSLVSRTDLAIPGGSRGVDPRRLAMIVAVLSRHAGIPLARRISS